MTEFWRARWNFRFHVDGGFFEQYSMTIPYWSAIVATFLLFAIISFAGAMFLIFLRGNVRKDANGKILRVSFGIRRFFLASFPCPVFYALCLLAAFLIGTAIAYIILMHVYVSESKYYLTVEFLSSDRFARMCLGGIFGVSFAVWTSRVYNSKPGEFSNFDRISSIVFIVVFVVGTTNITLEDVIRGFTLDVAGVKVSLPKAPETREEGPSYAVAPGGQEKKEVSTDFGRSYALGFNLLYNVGPFIKADIERAEQIDSDGRYRAENSKYPKSQQEEIFDLKKALSNYNENVFPAIRCIDALIEVSRQRDSHLDLLRQASFEVVRNYTSSLTKKPKQDVGFVRQDEIDSNRATPLLEGVNSGLNRGGYLKELADSAKQWESIISSLGTPFEHQGKLAECEKHINNLSFEFGSDQKISGKPYLAIVIAGLMQLWGNGNEIPAVQMLADWLSTYGKAHDSSHRMSVWYSLRIKSAQLMLLNSYIERVGNPPSETIGGYLTLLDSLIETIEGMPSVMARYDVLIANVKRSDNPRQMFATTWYLSGQCNKKTVQVNNDKFDHVASGLLESLVTIKLQYAHYAQKHRDFMARYQRKAKGIVDAIASSVDYSCVMDHAILRAKGGAKLQEQEEMAAIRGKIKEIYTVKTVDIIIAWAEMNNTIAYSLGNHDSAVKLEPGTKDRADSQFRNSIAALLLAKEMLAPFESSIENDEPPAIIVTPSLVSEKLDEIDRHYEFARLRLQ